MVGAYSIGTGPKSEFFIYPLKYNVLNSISSARKNEKIHSRSWRV
jgi:hypothetical protein